MAQPALYAISLTKRIVPCSGKDYLDINKINIIVKFMNAKDIGLIAAGVVFIGGLSAVEVMAGLYPNKVIYTIPAPELPVHKCAEYCREILEMKQRDEGFEKKYCR